jgi:hypothetical protein
MKVAEHIDDQQTATRKHASLFLTPAFTRSKKNGYNNQLIFISYTSTISKQPQESTHHY